MLQGTAIVLDCSATSYIDVMGIEAIGELYTDAKKNNTSIFFANLNGKVDVNKIFLIFRPCKKRGTITRWLWVSYTFYCLLQFC